jgi:AcrR family transcriptional regulator
MAESVTAATRFPSHAPHGGAEKFAARRAELAKAALQALGEAGYARTGLREIAQKTPFSHGVFHYYFKDKNDLICACVRGYKAHCVTRYDQILKEADSQPALLQSFLDKLSETLREEAPMHRLWYDLRAQALFNDVYRHDVVTIDRNLEDMIWRVLARYAELGGSTPAISRAAAYALLDGLFQKYLLQYLSGDESAVDALRDEVRDLLPRLG